MSEPRTYIHDDSYASLSLGGTEKKPILERLSVNGKLILEDSAWEGIARDCWFRDGVEMQSRNNNWTFINCEFDGPVRMIKGSEQGELGIARILFLGCKFNAPVVVEPHGLGPVRDVSFISCQMEKSTEPAVQLLGPWDNWMFSSMGYTYVDPSIKSGPTILALSAGDMVFNGWDAGYLRKKRTFLRVPGESAVHGLETIRVGPKSKGRLVEWT